MITNALPTLCCLLLAITIGIAGPDDLRFFNQFCASSTASFIHCPGRNPLVFLASTMMNFLSLKNHKSPSSLVPLSLNLSATKPRSLKYSTSSTSHPDPFLLLARDCLESNEIYPRSYVGSALLILICNLYSRWIDE